MEKFVLISLVVSLAGLGSGLFAPPLNSTTEEIGGKTSQEQSARQLNGKADGMPFFDVKPTGDNGDGRLKPQMRQTDASVGTPNANASQENTGLAQTIMPQSATGATNGELTTVDHHRTDDGSITFGFVVADIGDRGESSES
ncbi:MAG TPA: hypothetical protein VIT23_16305 [Terrimicrobiaceae bacterium]